MGKLFFIMGKSSSGKDTIYQKLMADPLLELKPVVGYTTRPIRENEKNGREYYFVSREELERLSHEGKVIECRDYQTVHGIWSYFTVADDKIDLEHGNYLYIGTLESYEKIVAYYGQEKVVPIFIEIDDGLRLERALKRERQQKNPDYKEMCRRFLADCEDFSEEKIQAAGIKKRYCAQSSEESYLVIKKMIQSQK